MSFKVCLKNSQLVVPARNPVIAAQNPVIPAQNPVIPAQAGIQFNRAHILVG